MSLEEASWTHEFTSEQLETWKTNHGRVWLTKIGSNEYVYRGITNAEFERLRGEERQYIAGLEQKGLTQDEVSQQTISNSMKGVVLTCLLFPENYAEKISSDLAGVLEVLQPAILESSGFPTQPPEIQEL